MNRFKQSVGTIAAFCGNVRKKSFFVTNYTKTARQGTVFFEYNSQKLLNIQKSFAIIYAE